MILHQPAGRLRSEMRRTAPGRPRLRDSSRSTSPSVLHRSPPGFRDSEEFSAAVEPHLPKLVSIARAYLKSEDLAWDAVQETLQRIWVRGFLPEEPGGVLAHLVKQSCLHQKRCLVRREYHEMVAAEQFETCCNEGPLVGLESSETTLTVRKAVRRVAEKYRVVLERVDLDGESYQAIAEELDIPVGTIRSRLSRGRRLLREQLTQSYGG